MKLVSSSTTAIMKKNTEAALNNFRDLMKVGHTPTPTPRGSRFMVIDYERPRTHENNMLIDLLAPDTHQNWRGSLRHNHVRLWEEKHDAMEHRYNSMMNKCQYERDRAKALAFNKDPFPAQFVLERQAEEARRKTKAISCHIFRRSWKCTNSTYHNINFKPDYTIFPLNVAMFLTQMKFCRMRPRNCQLTLTEVPRSSRVQVHAAV